MKIQTFIFVTHVLTQNMYERMPKINNIQKIHMDCRVA